MEKRTASYMLVQAADFETALKNLVEGIERNNGRLGDCFYYRNSVDGRLSV